MGEQRTYFKSDRRAVNIRRADYERMKFQDKPYKPEDFIKYV